MERLLLPPLRDYQIPVLTSEAIDDVTISAPQLGKTTVGQLAIINSAWLNGDDPRPWWWTAPTYTQAIHGIRGIAFMARSAGILACEPRLSPPLEVRLTNGARIEGRSWERPGGMYGPSVLGGVVDEFGQLTAEAYGAISSRRAETLTQGYGHFRYLGNVGEIGGVAEKLWNMASGGAPGFACRQWTWHDRERSHECDCDVPLGVEHASEHSPFCPRGIYVLMIAREAERMSTPQFRQLYEAEWMDWNALPVYEFDRAIHVSNGFELQDRLPVDLACDFNVDPMAWVVGQHKGDEAWALDEIGIPGGATTQEACNEFIRRYPNPKLEVVVYGDASGGARKTSASQTDYQIIQDIIGGFYHRFRCQVPRSNPAVADRINAFNGLLKSAIGNVRYRVHPRCKGLVNDLARVSWRQGTRDIDKTKDRTLTHFSDAEGYRLHELFPIRQYTEVAVGTCREDAPMHDSFATVAF